MGSLSPLPSLPVLIAEGGGTGITTMPILQSMSQARAKWGYQAAGAIWDASIVKVILGGTCTGGVLVGCWWGARSSLDVAMVSSFGSVSGVRCRRRPCRRPGVRAGG